MGQRSGACSYVYIVTSLSRSLKTQILGRSKLSAKHAEDRKQHRIEDRNANVTCFACRGVGHAARACPNILLAATTIGAPEEQGENESQERKEKEVGRRKGGKKGGDVTSNKCYRCVYFLCLPSLLLIKCVDATVQITLYINALNLLILRTPHHTPPATSVSGQDIFPLFALKTKRVCMSTAARAKSAVRPLTVPRTVPMTSARRPQHSSQENAVRLCWVPEMERAPMKMTLWSKLVIDQPRTGPKTSDMLLLGTAKGP